MSTAPAAPATPPERIARVRTVFLHARGAARWVAALEMLLQAIEQAAWDLRHAAEDIAVAATGAWRDAGATWRSARAEGSARSRELRQLLDVGATVATIVAWLRIRQIGAAFVTRARAQRAFAAWAARSGERLAALAERQQGGLIKVMQMLAARGDVLPAELIAPLRRLQDACAPLEAAAVAEVLHDAWGERAAQVQWDETPLGSGSIGQVHGAVLPDGRPVAVKLLRPGIAAALDRDMRNLRRVVAALAAYLPELDLTAVLDEIATQLQREVDLEREAAALRRTGQHLRGMPGLAVPTVEDDWSNKAVLVTARMHGTRIDLALAERHPERVADVLRRLVDVYARQILVWGFFQPDTHPGNFLVSDDDTVVLLDFGCARELPAATRDRVVSLVLAFLGGDDDGCARILGDLGFATRSGNNATLVRVSRELLGTVVGGGSDMWDVASLRQAGDRALHAIAADPLTRVPGDLVMVGRALLSLGGLFYTHRPEVDVGAILLPLIVAAGAQAA